jgi:hypothetical protein
MSSRTTHQSFLCEVEEKTYRSRSTVFHDSLLRNWRHSLEHILVIWNSHSKIASTHPGCDVGWSGDGKGVSLAELVIAERQKSLDRIRLSLMGLQF